MSLDVSFVLNSGHSCGGLEGLALAHISSHQLRNGVEIAALIPGRVRREDPPHSGGQSAASWGKLGFDADASPPCFHFLHGTYRHFGVLYI